MKLNFINKIIIKYVSQLFYVVLNESSKIIESNEKKFISTSTLQKCIEHLSEFGILYKKLNNKFLFFDNFVMNICDMIYCKIKIILDKFVSILDFRLNFNNYFQKILSLFMIIYDKNLKIYYKTKFNCKI